MKQLPLDISRAAAMREDVVGSAWATPYHEYHFMDKALFKAAISSIRQLSSEQRLSIIATARLSDILLDVGRVYRLAVDLLATQEKGLVPIFDSSASPVLNFLYSGYETNTIARARLTGHRREGYLVLPWKIKHYSQRIISTLKYGFNHPDIMQQNLLCNEYLNVQHKTVLPIMPWQEMVPDVKPLLSNELAVIDEICHSLLAVLPSSFHEHATLNSRVSHAINEIVRAHIAQGVADFKYIHNSFLHKKMGAALISGTPRSHGRLFSALYQNEGKPVIRFSHGGERGLIEDYGWGIAELEFCDTYYTHGSSEADFLGQRLNEKRIGKITKNQVKFKSIGSKKHQQIYAGTCDFFNKGIKKKGPIIYVTSLFTSEFRDLMPGHKAPDPLVLEWQLWLLKTLRDQGYEVIIKEHPKGYQFNRPTTGPMAWGPVLKGHFNPLETDAQCIIFDYPGTAFMDSLASQHAIIYLDMGIRTVDRQAVPLLDKRVSRIRCFFNEQNLFRLAPENLKNALEEAEDKANNENICQFVDYYFGVAV